MPGREEFKREYLESIAETCSKPFAECSRMERYTALAAMIRECCSGVRAETLRRRAAAGEKIVYYFSMEFLVGRLLENYLIQLGIRDMTADILAELGEDLDALLECERDPGLGNGGLGRLAACYLDSLAAEDVPCVGMGLRYRYGLFRQRIRSGCQTEEPDDWLSDGYPWETAVPSEAVEVRFGGTVDRREENGRMVYELRDYHSVLATPYDVPILGYGAHAVNNLRLWRASRCTSSSISTPSTPETIPARRRPTTTPRRSPAFSTPTIIPPPGSSCVSSRNISSSAPGCRACCARSAPRIFPGTSCPSASPSTRTTPIPRSACRS